MLSVACAELVQAADVVSWYLSLCFEALRYGDIHTAGQALFTAWVAVVSFLPELLAAIAVPFAVGVCMACAAYSAMRQRPEPVMFGLGVAAVSLWLTFAASVMLELLQAWRGAKGF